LFFDRHGFEHFDLDLSTSTIRSTDDERAFRFLLTVDLLMITTDGDNVTILVKPNDDVTMSTQICTDRK
jgi:hypothetical protein